MIEITTVGTEDQTPFSANTENIMTTESVENTSSGWEANTTNAYVMISSANDNYPALVMLTLLIILTCVANSIVIICCRKEKKLRTVSSLYIVSLAVADAIVGSTVMLGMLFYTCYGYWPLGFTICTIWMGFDYCACTVSMLHLILVAHDRYIALVHPLDYKTSRTFKDALKRLIVAWIIGILGWAPAIIAYQFINATEEGACYFLPDKLYVLFQACVAYYIPIIAMLYFYIRCIHVLRLRYLKTAASHIGDSTQQKILSTVEFAKSSVNNSSIQSSTTTGIDNGNDAQDAVKRAKLSKQQQQLRSFRTLGVIIVMFLLCWLPFCIMWPIITMHPEAAPLRLYEASYWLAYINSTINPFLYFICNRDFRDALKKLMKF